LKEWIDLETMLGNVSRRLNSHRLMHLPVCAVSSFSGRLQCRALNLAIRGFFHE
jgi:hypothetical protein